MAGQIKGTLDIAYSSDDPRNQRVAELVQTQLQALGVEGNRARHPDRPGVQPAAEQGPGPQLLISTVNPDAAHPDTWARIFMSTAGSLNWLQCSVPDADKLLDQGLNTTDPKVGGRPSPTPRPVTCS